MKNSCFEGKVGGTRVIGLKRHVRGGTRHFEYPEANDAVRRICDFDRHQEIWPLKERGVGFAGSITGATHSHVLRGHQSLSAWWFLPRTTTFDTRLTTAQSNQGLEGAACKSQRVDIFRYMSISALLSSIGGSS